MSCASPLPHLSPPSLHMTYNAGHNLDDPEPLHRHSSTFSFAVPATPSFCSRSSGSPSRPALTDILVQRHHNSPRNKADVRSPLSPRNTFKENRENGGSQKDNARTASIDGPQSPLNKAAALFNSPGLRSPRPGYTITKENKGRVHKEVVETEGLLVEAVSASPSPSSLKRKRPTKLAIPEFARMASFEKAKDFELPEHESLSSKILSSETPIFAVSCKKGRKDCMEDAHTATTSFQGNTNEAFFGVFDGHGGKSAAQFAAENLSKHIATAIQRLKEDPGHLITAMEKGYLATDKEFLAKGLSGGACSVSAFMKGGRLVVANAGDCKAVLCRRGKAEALSDLHRASNLEERRRIETLGGFVDCFNGVWRIQGTLAVTRSFGDIHLKQWVIAEPQVLELQITHDCEFLILASDGLWDKVSNQEAVDCARECLQNLWAKEEALALTRPSKAQRHHYLSFPNIDKASADKQNPNDTSSFKTDACNKLIHKACSRGNIDDITVMIISLREFEIA